MCDNVERLWQIQGTISQDERCDDTEQSRDTPPPTAVLKHQEDHLCHLCDLPLCHQRSISGCTHTVPNPPPLGFASAGTENRAIDVSGRLLRRRKSNKGAQVAAILSLTEW